MQWNLPKFITQKKSNALIEKIHTLTSPGQVSKLKRNNYIADRIKPDNEQISFQYYDYTGLKKKVLKNKGEVYKISPYHLLWNGDYYYVIGYSEKKGKIVTFRVDRIAATPEILEKESVPQPEGFNIADFTKEVFFMYDGDEVTVDLRCDNSLITEVSASQTFFGWVFGFGGKVQILASAEIKEQYRQMIMKATADVADE